VLRGNIIALPIGDGFLYVESIYIQATEARMPQLKKIVLAMGNRLIYRDTFEQALEELTAGAAPPPRRAEASAPGTPAATPLGPQPRRPPAPPPRADPATTPRPGGREKEAARK
jgi:uncharacterized membrane protein (UPF0182 family)